MGEGRETVRAWVARFGRWSGYLLVLAVLAAPASEMRAAASLRALDRHAVVMNGAIVGSAFAIADGLAVTNRHVVAGLRPGARVQLLASGPGHGIAAASLVAISPRMDLALLRMPVGLMPAVTTEPSGTRAGEMVVAAGVDASEGPGGERYEAAGEVVTPLADIAAFGPGMIVSLPQGRPGFSGGPMFDRGGRFVGMVTALRTEGGAGSPRIEAYALRADAIRTEVARLMRASRGRE